MKSVLKKIVVAVLTLEARAVISRHKPRIVAVTGNVGKTSTKDAIDALLSNAYGARHVRKSQKSLNSEIGLPLAILGLDNAWSNAGGWIKNIFSGFLVVFLPSFMTHRRFPSWLVLEIGADHPGDIETISKWLHPDIVVLTRMSDVPVHVEFFKDANDVLREKMFLARALKSGGTLVVNADDPHFMAEAKRLEMKKVFYGKAKGAIGVNLAAEIAESDFDYDTGTLPLPTGERATIKVGGEEAVVRLAGVLGEHLVYPAAAACAVLSVLETGGVAALAEKAFRAFEAPSGRMRILRGINSSAIIDDTYNASPLAAAEALRTMEKLVLKGKKIAALADMKELGLNSEKAHYDIGKLAGGILHTLVTVGPAARFMVQGALDAGLSPERIVSVDTSEEAGKAIVDIVRAGDVVLLKGSQSMRMERATKMLLADKTEAANVLVRQEEEWIRR